MIDPAGKPEHSWHCNAIIRVFYSSLHPPLSDAFFLVNVRLTAGGAHGARTGFSYSA